MAPTNISVDTTSEREMLQKFASMLQKEEVASSKDALADVLTRLEGIPMTRLLLKQTRIKRAVSAASQNFDNLGLGDRCKSLLKAWRRVKKESQGVSPSLRRSRRNRNEVSYKELSIREQEKQDSAEPAPVAESGDPADLSIQSYRQRLIRGRKELYKDPPVLPPMEVHGLEERKPEPKRDSKTGEFHFPDFPEFRPNLSPKEV